MWPDTRVLQAVSPVREARCLQVISSWNSLLVFRSGRFAFGRDGRDVRPLASSDHVRVHTRPDRARHDENGLARCELECAEVDIFATAGFEPEALFSRRDECARRLPRVRQGQPRSQVRTLGDESEDVAGDASQHAHVLFQLLRELTLEDCAHGRLRREQQNAVLQVLFRHGADVLDHDRADAAIAAGDREFEITDTLGTTLVRRHRPLQEAVGCRNGQRDLLLVRSFADAGDHDHARAVGSRTVFGTVFLGPARELVGPPEIARESDQGVRRQRGADAFRFHARIVDVGLVRLSIEFVHHSGQKMAESAGPILLLVERFFALEQSVGALGLDPCAVEISARETRSGRTRMQQRALVALADVVLCAFVQRPGEQPVLEVASREQRLVLDLLDDAHRTLELSNRVVPATVRERDGARLRTREELGAGRLAARVGVVGLGQMSSLELGVREFGALRIGRTGGGRETQHHCENGAARAGERVRG
ncbi:MAG: hypothetical protein ACSLFQ_06020, partial [Thermoanaerobaculia bacterium]